jgi:hypothetical protein
MGNHGLKKQCILDWIPVDSRELKGGSLRDKDHLDPVSPSGSTMKRDEKLLMNTNDSFIVVIQNSVLDTGMSSQITKGAATKRIEAVTSLPTRKYSLQHTSVHGTEQRTRLRRVSF